MKVCKLVYFRERLAQQKCLYINDFPDDRQLTGKSLQLEHSSNVMVIQTLNGDSSSQQDI